MAADLTISVDIDARKTKAGANEAKKNIKDVREETEKLGKSSKSVADRDLSALTNRLAGLKQFAGGKIAALGIGAALLVIGAAAAKAAEMIFTLTKAFADYAVEIGKANEITGLSIAVLSGLRVQAELAGRSFDEVGEGLKNFIKTIGDANNGSKEASAKLTRLGLDAAAAAQNLDKAFEQAVKRILSVKPGVEQVNASIDAFGENGPKLLPFLKSFGGDLNAVKQKAEELGVMLSEDDVRAAKEFNKAFAEVQQLLRGVGFTFAKELLPVVRNVITDIGQYLKDNKGEIRSWAQSVAEGVKWLVAQIKPELEDIRGIIDTINWLDGGPHPREMARQRAVKSYFNSLPPPVINQAVQDAVPTRVPGVNYDSPYLGNNTSPGRPGRTARSSAAVKDPVAENAQQIRDVIKDLQLQIDYFGQSSEEASVKQQLMRQGVLLVNRALADQAIALGATLDRMKAKADADKQFAEAQKRLNEDFAKEKAGLLSDSFNENVGLGADLNKLKEQIALGRELTAVEERRIEIAAERIVYERQLQTYGYTQDQVTQLLAIFDVEKARTLEILKLVQAKRDLIAAEQAYKNLIGGLTSEITDLTIQLQEYTTGLQISRVELLLMSEAYKKLNEEQQKEALSKAKQIDGIRAAIEEQQRARQAYDDLYNTIRDGLDVLAEQGFGAFFKNVMRKFRDFLLDLATQWITSKFFKMFFQGGNQQAAASSGSGDRSIFGAIQQLFTGGGAGPGGTAPYNPNAGTGVGGESAAAAAGFPPGFQTLGGYSSTGGGGLFKHQLFQGGLSTGIGIASAAGSVIGGAIGGTAGNIISLASTGLGIGFMVGGPIGAAIGAAIGAGAGILMRIFGGDPKRKRDKREKMPQLNRGFTDALQELRSLVGDVRTLRVSPEGAISRATELRNAIASGFGIQFESKKYQKEAQKLIQSRLVEADTLIAELRKAAEVANAASERDRRILPEFASGVFMSADFTRQYQEFRRRNGMLPGAFTGRDSMPSMLAPGEMVLNPAQQSRVRANAGGMDPFVDAGIPGYGGANRPQQAVDVGGDVNITVHLSQDSSGIWKAEAESSKGKKIIVDIVADSFRNDGINTKRRGV